MTAPGNVDGDATIASSATTPPEEWPTTSIGSPITFATARTSSASWSIVHGEPVTMSSRYWRRCRRTTRKRGASRAATFPHDLPSSMPGTSCATPVHSAGRTASPSSSRPSAPSSRKRMDRAGAASIDSSWAMMAGTALRSNLACPSSWSRSSPQIRVGSAGCGRRWPGPASAPEGWVGPQQGRCCCWAWTRPLSTRTPTSRAMALLALPKPARGRAILVRADSAGATHAFVDELVGRNLAFSVGFDCDQRVRDAILALPEDAFTPALDPTVGRAVVPGLLSLRAWTLPARAGRRAPGRSAAASDPIPAPATRWASPTPTATASRSSSPTSPTPTRPSWRPATAPRPRGGPHPRRQGHRPAEPAVLGLCRQRRLAEPGLYRPDPGLLGAGAAAGRRLQARQAQDAALPAVARGRSDRTACPPSDRARGPRLALGYRPGDGVRQAACPARPLLARSRAEVAPRGYGAPVGRWRTSTSIQTVRACRIRRSQLE